MHHLHAADLPELRSDVDHVAAAPIEHARQHEARTEEDASEVDAEDTIPFFDRELVEEELAECARVVHEDIDRAELRVGPVGQGPHLLLVGDVRPHE